MSNALTTAAPKKPKKELRRDRKGQYVAECAYCSCPDGCACDGNGCGCGTSKAAR